MLISPSGLPIASTKRDVTFTDKALCSFAAVADDAFRALGGLTVVCLSCGETPQMTNHPNDPQWVMECSCTIRRLVNPEATRQTH